MPSVCFPSLITSTGTTDLNALSLVLVFLVISEVIKDSRSTLFNLNFQYSVVFFWLMFSIFSFVQSPLLAFSLKSKCNEVSETLSKDQRDQIISSLFVLLTNLVVGASHLVDYAVYKAFTGILTALLPSSTVSSDDSHKLDFSCVCSETVVELVKGANIMYIEIIDDSSMLMATPGIVVGYHKVNYF